MGKRIIIYGVMQNVGRTFMMKPPTFERVVARAVAALACSLAYALASHAQSLGHAICTRRFVPQHTAQI